MAGLSFVLCLNSASYRVPPFQVMIRAGTAPGCKRRYMGTRRTSPGAIWISLE